LWHYSEETSVRPDVCLAALSGLLALAADLVALKVDVLVTVGIAPAPYANDATPSIPIVFTLVSDPVGIGLVRSIAAPGGNATGLSSLTAELTQKRLQLLKEIVPSLSRFALLVNPNEQGAHVWAAQAAEAAPTLEMTFETFEVRSLGEIDQRFASIEQSRAQAVVLAPGGLLYQGRALIAKLALAARLPTCAWSKETLQAGMLISYGTDQQAVVRRAAVYVDKILKGSKPAELPVELPSTFQLLINLTTAKELGINLPPGMMSLANELIE
jgi:putative ABC transport system substrate-binding protein